MVCWLGTCFSFAMKTRWCGGYGCYELSQLELPDTREAKQFREGRVVKIGICIKKIEGFDISVGI